MFSKNLFSVISLALFVFIGNTALADCPSADLTGDCFVDYEDFGLMYGQWLNGYDSNDLTEMASQWLTEGTFDIVWVDVNDPGVPGHETFNGQMSKYETTNAQYCQFLNAALYSNDIYVSNDKVYGNSGPYNGWIYFDTYAASSYSQITYSGGTFSTRSRDGYSMANHPVVMVSWYGAMAFCDYYGYRLPTEWEWQAVADYDSSYTYGCGTTIDYTKANYDIYDPLGLTGIPCTSPVNYYSSFGYGINDMAGNAAEWTSTVSGTFRVVRGGSWVHDDVYCTVSYRSVSRYPYVTNSTIGFRVCR